MTIHFLYFEGCPHSKETRAHLEEALTRLGLEDVPVQEVRIENQEDAERWRFPGSPTILVDGKDLVTGREPEEVGFTCRVYHLGGKTTGVLPVDVIVERLASFLPR
ncbi:hypothetical protein [Spirochaeta thermophila]|nr:hypothetical protein [Spirochaeta thermophila]